MELSIRDGDYRCDETGAPIRAEGREELLERVLWKLRVKRGSFPLLPALGSRLHLLPQEKPSARRAAAEQYVREALADEEDLEIIETTIERDGELSVTLRYGAQSLRATVTVDG